MNTSTTIRPETGPLIVDLRGQQGNFETAQCHPQGCRTFGFWSMSTPVVGDLVIRPSGNGKALYKIKSVRCTFEGREGDSYYEGEMVDVIDSYNRLRVNLLTPADHAAIEAYDRSHP